MRNSKRDEETPHFARFLHRWRNYTHTSFEEIYHHCHIRKSNFTRLKRGMPHHALTRDQCLDIAAYLYSLLDDDDERALLEQELGHALLMDYLATH